MIKIEIPGREIIQAGHLVLDYNGTLAIDGILIPGVEERLNTLADKMAIHVVTADTFGKARQSLSNIRCSCDVIQGKNHQQYKKEFVSQLGAEKVIAIGNGLNDALMVKEAALGIVLIQAEGASAKALANADIVCTDIIDALDLLDNPLRIAATLRI